VYLMRSEVCITVAAGGSSRLSEDVFGGKDSMKNAQQTDADCDKCGNKRAYFMELQTRSADEPMTIFYQCTECGYRWKE